MHTPFGNLALSASDAGITRVRFTSRPEPDPTHPHVTQAVHELDEYFAGRRTEFTVPVDLGRVDPLARRILAALSTVEYGTTTTYGALATTLGLVDDGPRQVGAAMARNPVLILVPCHRVVGANGRLTGYAGGIPTKQALLDLEARDRAGQLALPC